MRQPAATVVLLLVALAGLGFDSSNYQPSETTYYLRGDGSGCPPDRWLGTSAGSGEPACGYVGGAPAGELHHAGLVADTVNHFSTRSAPNARLDASRDITGRNRIAATADTNRNAVGQVRVDVTVYAAFQGGGTAVLGTHSRTIDWVPGQTAGEVDFPFTVDVPGEHDGKVITQLNLDVDIRGWHVLTGYHRLNGQSRFTLPTWVPKPR